MIYWLVQINIFLPNQNVEYFIFTNHKSIKASSIRPINLIDTTHKEWPWMTLGRYKNLF
jgi:hypothetical protein